MTLYLSDEGTFQGFELEDQLEYVTEDALNVIAEAMNGSPERPSSPFLEGSGGEYGVSGLAGIRFIGGRTYNGRDYDGSSSPNGKEPGTVAGAKSNSPGAGGSRLETAGYSLLAAGAASLIAMAIAFVVLKRRRERADESYSEFEDDIDCGKMGTEAATSRDELSLTPTSPTASTAPSTPGRSAVYVLGEDEMSNANSSYANSRSRLPRDLTRYLHRSHESGNGNADGVQVDVHHCTSAMCPVCNGRGTEFVDALEEEDDEASGIQPGIEFGYSKRYSPRRLPEPKFDNPSMIERPYVVEDTVDF